MLILNTTLQEAATSGAGAVVDTEGQARELSFYVLGNGSVSAGEVTIEEAHESAYGGTWAPIGSPMTVSANAVQVRRLRGACRAVRARITTAIVGGTVTVFLMGSAEGGIAPAASAMITLGIGTPSSVEQFLLVGLGDGEGASPPSLVPIDPAVYPDDIFIELGLGGSYRHRLINENFVALCLPLHESKRTQARDICGMRNDGTYVGAGFTRAVPFTVPEGALGATFAGSEYVEVPDDVLSTGRNMSAAGGSLDVTVMIKTSQNDATLRCIAQKQETNSTGIGWHVAHQNGQIRFALYTSGSPSEVFNFARGSISDGEEHRVHCCYEPEQGRARIFIDGVQSGTTVTGVTTEPEYSAATLRVGMFNNGAGGFIGTLCYVMVGREGNPDLSSQLEPTLDWTDVTEDVLITQMPVSWRRGIFGTGVQDNVAGPGTMTFALDNGDTNTLGLLGAYTVGHENCRAGFKAGIPVRLTIRYDGEDYVKFRGFIKAADPVPGEHGELYTSVTCVDWMHVAMRAFTSALPIQISKASDTLFGIVVDGAERPPAAIEFNQGSEDFPFAFDSSQGEDDAPMSEFVRIMASERGYAYLRGDGTLVDESRTVRQIETDLAATFTFQHGLDPTYDVDRIINLVRATFYPRRADSAATTVLASLPTEQSEHFVPPGGVVEIESAYRDPAQKLSRVGGTDMEDPTPSTDFTMHANADGTGTVLTSQFTVEAVDGGNLVRWRVENTSTTTGGYITKLQARGRGLYHEEAQTVLSRDDDSIREHGERPLKINLPYVSSMSSALGIANMILGFFSQQERVIPVATTLLANYNDQTMRDVLARDIGHRIGLEEPVTAIDTNDGMLGFYIQSEEGTIEPGDIVRVKLGLSLPLPTGAWVVGEEGFAEVGETTYVGL